MIFFSLLLVVILLLLVSFFVALETAIVSTTPGRVQYKVNLDDPSAKILMHILKNKEKVISTLVIVISILQTVATTVATGIVLYFVSGSNGTIIASAVMSVMIIIFAEVIPKGVAVSNPEPIAIKYSKMIYYLMVVMMPLNKALEIIFKIFCYVFRVKTKSDITPNEEVRGIIDHYHKEGDVVKDDKDMLQAVLDLNEITVSEIMVHRSMVLAFDIDEPIVDVVSKVLKAPYTRLPFWKDTKDNVIGVLHIRDLIYALHKVKYDYSKIKLENLIDKPWFVPENTSLSNQLVEFKKRKNHLAIVVDEYGDIMGIITLEDILEEIVGQIDDEYDKNSDSIIKKSNNKYIIEGKTTIRDINRELGIDLPDDDAHTIVGLMMHKMEKLPNLGESLMIKNIKITVVKKNSHKISNVLVEILN